MKKILLLFAAASLILCTACGNSVSSSENNESSSSESDKTVTKVDFGDVTFEISPYWISERESTDHGNYLQITTDKKDHFTVCEGKLNESFDTFESYCDFLIESYKDDEETTVEVIENSNGVKMCRYFKGEDRPGAYVLWYRVQFTGAEFTDFVFTSMGDSYSYISDIIESVEVLS